MNTRTLNPPYKKGKIYGIVCFETARIYVGSTTDTLGCRLGDHKSACRRVREGLKKYNCASAEILNTGNYGIFLIETFPCENRRELLTREGYWIDEYRHSCVNRMSHSHQN